VARFTLAPLRLLDGLYRFVGGLKGESTMDLTSPIVRVHDLSREAELGTYNGKESAAISSANPFFTINVDNVHGGAGAVRLRIGVYANQDTGWALATWDPPEPLRETVWILHVGMNVDTAAMLTDAMVTNEFLPKAGNGGGADPQELVGFVDTLAATTLTNGWFPCLDSNGNNYLPAPRPVMNKLDTDLPIEFCSVAAAAGVVDLFITCLRLPTGVFPPGLH